jgi:hypothetical protein
MNVSETTGDGKSLAFGRIGQKIACFPKRLAIFTVFLRKYWLFWGKFAK